MNIPAGFKRYVVFDVETTGLSPKYGARVIEIGAVAIEDGRITEEFHSLINIESPIPKAVQRIHGITDAMLVGQPKPRDIIPVFHSFIKDSVLVAHNANFDLGFIRHELERLNITLSNDHMCTLKLARSRYPHLPSHKLEAMARHLLGELPGDVRLHRALDDARLTARMWVEMMKLDFAV